MQDALDKHSSRAGGKSQFVQALLLSVVSRLAHQPRAAVCVSAACTDETALRSRRALPSESPKFPDFGEGPVPVVV
jgi:hypothetical protein